MRILAGLVLRGLGWRYHMPEPPSKKYVLIGAPHTSNWDFFVGLLALWALGIRARWLGKKELFRPPLGWLLRLLGGIPVDRSRRSNLVDQVAAIFQREEEIAILITPEGTRSQAPYWRTGFYYMALKAGVPIALGYADFRRKEVGIGGYLWPTGDIRRDFAEIRAFYQDKVGLRPEKQGPIRIRDEVEGVA
ncbi:lysophospholipid acyltransferase family protein [Thermus tengchongensis]|uniref:Glycerol acyltransferase n=1 Tax=Thermus tengchongensis TaxID=1214928 RepID=A0A4Y9FDJ0_9DEIN|nr:lysophospholipid acyltransferase family protein [Thermus tengchongensis]TFU17138.1 glycerol acyltransferase [Thermus tengchongensis]TFU27197.1 glycerol acyltransferase [Thermus tengchongensis]